MSKTILASSKKDRPLRIYQENLPREPHERQRLFRRIPAVHPTSSQITRERPLTSCIYEVSIVARQLSALGERAGTIRHTPEHVFEPGSAVRLG